MSFNEGSQLDTSGVDLAQVQPDRFGYLQASEQQRRLYGVVAPALPRFG